ncbi:MAG TPA: lysylphosphatidylglycerol synthase domain-containing protein [Nocardioides sp.]|uniref:lysylphosphatidylglycerol synthase domain-containing protein n=1 Tax=Nocardioides sp. TaxID=35761 RepID=UPI002CEBCE40|nr:lysylphosphatidylglycerol synthase domain-containing protein [Nocardioides sp.]HTW13858.1 lysylphosphatidylglycerol synthase domain-containing protein [Nocardioides sp.]
MLVRIRAFLGAVLRSRMLLALGVLVSLVVPVVTLPRLPAVSPWPVLLGIVPWVVGKYLLCPLRWRALTPAGLTRRWHLRAYAESELLGLLTPGHVGADLWRITRLTRAGLGRGDAVLSVGTDRLVGALGLGVFAVVAGTSLPLSTVVAAIGVSVVVVVIVVVLRRLRPGLLPIGPLPPPRALAQGLALSAGYQLTIAGLLLGSLASTGHSLPLWAIVGAFGASQLAGAIPGPHGASPRDGALVLGLVAAGVPVAAAVAAVAVQAAVAWLPALALGGSSLLLRRRAALAAA